MKLAYRLQSNLIPHGNILDFKLENGGFYHFVYEHIFSQVDWNGRSLFTLFTRGL